MLLKFYVKLIVSAFHGLVVLFVDGLVTVDFLENFSLIFISFT